jgi:RNA polymerase sigma factor (sigma-70 family)
MYDEYLLLSVLADNDHRALKSLMEKYAAFVRATCTRALEGDAYAAEDATQAVFIVMAQEGHNVRKGESLAGWLFKVSAEVVDHLKRHESLRRRRAAVVAALRDNTRTPIPKVADLGIAREHLNAAICALDDQQRDAIVMRYLQGKTVRNISHELECGEDDVEGRIRLGLKKLNAYFRTRRVKVDDDEVLTLLKAEQAASEPRGDLADATEQAVVAALAGNRRAETVAIAIAEQARPAIQRSDRRPWLLKVIFVILVTLFFALAIASC